MMANEEHLAIITQGVEVWNKWREQNPDVRVNLRGIEFGYRDLSDANLSDADFTGANLYRVVLINANLQSANLRGVNFGKANFYGANLRRAILRSCNLTGANLRKADLGWAVVVKADLREADLREAILVEADLSGSNLASARVEQATFGWTIIGNCDLRQCKGLESTRHMAPSSIGIDTLYWSLGDIPVEFLHGAGVPDDVIAISPSLIRRVPNFYSCFISYSSSDHSFAELVYDALQRKGVRCWFAPEDMKIGDKIRLRIDESIQYHDKLLLVLSRHSVASAWVEQEVETALERERRLGKTILFPIRLDDAVMEIETGWPALIRNTRHIGDFTQWQDPNAYQTALERLLKDLKAVDKTPSGD